MRESAKKEISLIYEKRRANAADNLENRRRALYDRIPGVEELDYQIKHCGISMSRAAISGDKDSIEKLQNQINALKVQKDSLFTQYSINPSELTIRYVCEKCKDTGFINNGTIPSKCSCYRSLVIENLYKDFTLDPDRTMTFEKFKINYYPDYIDKDRFGTDISPLEKMSQNYNICWNFVNDFGDKALKNLLFFGYAGVGKTFMCGCVANALIEKGVPVLYISATEMFNIITASRMGKNDIDSDKPGIDDLINIELLIIDDLGTENLTEARCSEFLEILNKKKERNGRIPCHIIISTNLTPREIYARYSERIGSRITSEFTCCRFVGEDIRILQA